MAKASFSIYNASAGSGKTYTLVKEYLRILLGSKRTEPYKHLLAITFTNKAVAEMKDRVLNSLMLFGRASSLEDGGPMFSELCAELGMHPTQLQLASERLLKQLLHNYAFFDISTIDHFTHRIIRTFAYDLDLPLNFEVELDTDRLIGEAVDRLISKAGEDSTLTKVLIDFSLEKADEDKSWDIAWDLNKIGKLLLRENDYYVLKEIGEKKLSNFSELKAAIRNQIKTNEDGLSKLGKSSLDLIKETGLEHSDFSGKYSAPEYFSKLKQRNFKVSFDTVWQSKLVNGEALYKAKTPQHVIDGIESIQSLLAKSFLQSKEAIEALKFLKNFYKHITPLSILNAIQTCLKEIQEEQNLLLISEFNRIISETISDEPAPFIYERLGERYRHFFIDEFQDTSTMQWNNLIPLVQHALEGHIEENSGSLLLVGDPKQSIYRWRGGSVEQFLELLEGKTPFFTQAKVENLDRNFRSYDRIIEFNNAFFSHVASQFELSSHKQLYLTGNKQKANHRVGGYVNLSFIEAQSKEEEHQQYSEKVLERIALLQKEGFKLKDICILTRKKEEGIRLASLLSDHGIPIISSEILLVSRSAKVQMIIHLLELIVDPHNMLAKIEVLQYLTAQSISVKDKHEFYQELMALNGQVFFKRLEQYGISFDLDDFQQDSLLEGVEYIIRSFNLITKPDAYVQYFLDFVLDFTQRKSSNHFDFLAHWEQKKDSLSITMLQGSDAIQIMTIHKSKGLEFSVVLFPYADVDIFYEKEPKTWFPIAPEKFEGFNYAYLNYSKSLAEVDKVGEEIVAHREAQKQLDNINLLYVALTRAVEQLHIFTKKELDKKGNERLQRYSGLFINFLKQEKLWKDNILTYTFGAPKKVSIPLNIQEDHVAQEKFISVPKEQHRIRIITKQASLWDTAQEAGISRGNLIHDLMAEVKSIHDIDTVLEEFLSRGAIEREQEADLRITLHKVVKHPMLRDFFDTDHLVYNERDIITKEGVIIRPDRLVIAKDGTASILDYKTGGHQVKYNDQLNRYSVVLEEMNYDLAQKVLVYVNEEIEVVKV
ncbi:UvrD-helicase domain-containing protein [Sungkyunkwania multivorans]|uniref:DNA 3'-5' helicase n=1 Tax=Sungkyunkwania multivorans TaxID=1173618 RepID=A0ABW3D2B8_9FLAO